MSGGLGRELIRRGECLFVIEVADNGLRLLPAGTWNVTGSAASWRYQVSLAGPSSTATRELAASSILHFRYAVDPARPWHGLGPIQFASIAGRLNAETDNTLASESGGPMANLLPIPVDGQDPTVTALREDIAKAKGKALTVESTTGDWNDPKGGRSAVRFDWRAERLGAAPPAALVELARNAERSVLATCGVPVELAEAGDGTGQREAWRRFLFGSVAPLAKIVTEELRGETFSRDRDGLRGAAGLRPSGPGAGLQAAHGGGDGRGRCGADRGLRRLRRRSCSRDGLPAARGRPADGVRADRLPRLSKRSGGTGFGGSGRSSGSRRGATGARRAESAAPPAARCRATIRGATFGAAVTRFCRATASSEGGVMKDVLRLTGTTPEEHADPPG